MSSSELVFRLNNKSDSSNLDDLTNADKKQNKIILLDDDESAHDDSISNSKFTFYICALLGFIIVVGILANLVNIIVFCQKSIRKKSTFRFLI